MLKNGGTGRVELRVTKRDGQYFNIPVKHTLSKDQCGFVLAGSALNLLAKKGELPST